ncbi:MAG: septum formation initiator family protein [Candidatus Magasanikbacteria bacterium]
MKKEKQSVFRRFFGSRLFLLMALILVIFVAFGYARAYYQDYKIKQEIRALQDEVKGLEHKKLESMEILKYVTSPAFVEEKARNELNLKKPGENVMVIKVSEKEAKKLEDQPVDNSALDNPMKWWYYFNHKSIN